MCTPFLIRHWGTGQEFELSSKEAFDRVYGDNPSWYIATGPFCKHAYPELPPVEVVDGEFVDEDESVENDEPVETEDTGDK